MAKISPVSTKYLIHAKFEAHGAVEKPDIIGALFGQTEGLLGSELEIRELQKEGKIGRIEVQARTENGKTTGDIQIPTSLDQSETSLIAAAIETIERIGPTEAKIEIVKIEDVRGSKRDYILERAKKLLQGIEGSTSSREISDVLKTSSRTSKIQEYGEERLPAGNLDNEEIIVVEGRADVLNLLRNRIDNVIGMNGTKLPETIKKLSYEKTLILFLDGDRGGKLIAKNVIENSKVAYVAFAPDGKEVEELNGKEILASLRKKIPAREFSFFFSRKFGRGIERENERERGAEIERESREERIEDRERETRKIGEERENEEVKEIANETEEKIDREKLQEVFSEAEGTKKAYIIDKNLNVIRRVSSKLAIRNLERGIYGIVLDGTATSYLIKTAERNGCKIIAAKNFVFSEETNVELISF